MGLFSGEDLFLSIVARKCENYTDYLQQIGGTQRGEKICGNWIKNITNDIGENKHIGENLLLSNVESKIIDTVNRTYYLQYFFLVILV